MYDFPVLVGDIGGTNARFALIQDAHSEPVFVGSTRICEHQGIDAAIERTVLDRTSLLPKTLILAIAGPLDGEVFKLTNAGWRFPPRELISHFDLSTIVIMNDFAAQALAAISLDEVHLRPVGSGAIAPGKPKIVLGPGTGLGIAKVINSSGKWIILPGEGGHIDLGPRTEREFRIWPHLDKETGRMSAELALSGRGIENLYRAICKTDTGDAPAMSAEQITGLAIAGTDSAATEAVDLFLTLLGRLSGDMALLTLARGGVYIAGGIAAKLVDQFSTGAFLSAYEHKDPHSQIVKAIGVRVITHPTAALEGLIAYARSPDFFEVESAVIVQAA